MLIGGEIVLVSRSCCVTVPKPGMTLHPAKSFPSDGKAEKGVEKDKYDEKRDAEIVRQRREFMITLALVSTFVQVVIVPPIVKYLDTKFS